MICPIQLLRPAKKPMAGPSSCKGQNKVGDNFKIGAQRVNVLVSSMWPLIKYTGSAEIEIVESANIDQLA